MKSGESCSKWLIVSKHKYGATVEIGLKNSLDYLQKQGKISYQIMDDQRALEAMSWADVVVLVRTVDREMKWILDVAKEMKKQTIYYVDDYLYDLPTEAREWGKYNTSDKKEGIAYFMHQADCVVTCSPWLTDQYEEQFGIKGVWIYPAIQGTRIRCLPKKDRPLVIGVAGSSDYARILTPIKPVFIALKQKYKNQVQFEFFGPKVAFLEEIQGIYYQPLAYDLYELLMARRQWDIGIAYNEETAFSSAKFYNKYLEYARLGIPGVYSDIALFRRVITNKVNGILAQHTYESWLDQIEQLINDASLREQIKHNAYHEVMQVFSAEQGAIAIETKLERFL